MTRLSIGDGAQHFLNARHNTLLKSRLNVLSEELATGRVHDLDRKLGGDRNRFASVERSLSLLNGYDLAAVETEQTLGMMQTTLGMVDDMRVSLAGHLVPISSASSTGDRENAALAAQNAFGSIVGSLNTRLADRSLFAGTATNAPALAPAKDILSALTTAIGGATDAAGVIAAVDAWFDTPGGGFDTLGYTGDPNDPIERRVDVNQSVSISAKANDPAVRSLLKAAALGALANGAASLTADDTASLMRKAGEDLMSAGQGLAEVQARLGGVEARIEEVKTSQTARRTALSLLQNDMVSADPYETATALQEVQLQLETHYTLTARLSHLSLTEYLR